MHNYKVYIYRENIKLTKALSNSRQTPVESQLEPEELATLSATEIKTLQQQQYTDKTITHNTVLITT